MSILETDLSDRPENDDSASNENEAQPVESTEHDQELQAEKVGFSSVVGDGIDLGSLRVALEVCLGEVSLDLGELSDIRKGSVLQTELDLTASVAIRVGEKKLGSGELVMIGDAVGIHVTNWPRTGLNER